MPAQSLAPRARRHEADSFARQGADPPLRFAIVSERPARRIDARGERRIRHDPPAPYRGQQILLAHDPIAVADQVNEKVENLGFDGYNRHTAPKLALIGVESIILKQIERLEAHPIRTVRPACRMI